MATIGTAVTLQDFKRREDNNGNIDQVIELLEDTNEILDDMLWVECNDGTGHKTTVRTGIPEATWRKLNYGVPSAKSTTRQVKDATGMLEVYAKVDKALAEINGNSAAWRLSEETAFIQGISNQLASTIFYGDSSVNPERFTGLTPRYLTPSADEDLSGFNIIDGGGNDDNENTSIWLIGWSPLTVHGLYPKGSVAGLTVRDLGEDTFTDAAGGEYQGLRTHYKWDCGLSVRDWRYVVRIANVDVADAVAGNVDLPKFMIEAAERVPQMGSVRWAFYCHRTIRTALRNRIRSDVSNQLTFDTVAGKRVLAFDGIPVRRCDAILKTEDDLTGTFGS